MSKSKIRKISFEDFGEKLLEIDNLAFCKEYDYPSRNLEEHLSYLKDTELYGLFNEEELRAYFAVLKLDDSAVELRTMAVLPYFQGKGFGNLMLKKFIELTSRKNLKLVTHPKNERARHLYLKYGFEIIGSKDNYFGDGEPRLLLQKLK